MGTPYHHRGAIKGVGTDCLWILIRIFGAHGFVPDDFDPGNYSPDWYMHHDEELYLKGVERFAHRTCAPLSGDVAMYKIGRTVSHGAVIVDHERRLMVHAHRKSGRVELAHMDAPALLARFHSYWSVFA